MYFFYNMALQSVCISDRYHCSDRNNVPVTNGDGNTANIRHRYSFRTKQRWGP